MLEVTSPSLSETTSEGIFPSYTGNQQQVKASAAIAPYFTSSTSFPHLQNQEFFNAIENRFSLKGPFAKEQQQQQVLGHQPISIPTIKLPSLDSNKQNYSITIISKSSLAVSPFSSTQINKLVDNPNALIIDTRSFVKYNQLHIRNSINIAIPNTILRRPSFTLDKIAEAIASNAGSLLWKNYMQMTHIILYDDQSSMISESSPNAIYYLTMKLLNSGGYQGVIGFASGGMDAFTQNFADNCIGEESSNAPKGIKPSSSTIPPTPGLSGLPPVVVGSLPTSKKRLKRRPIDGLHLGSLPQPPMANSNSTSQFANQEFNPFFSNIRQNMELSHGSIKERFAVRFPKGMQYDASTGLVMLNGKQHQMRYCAGMPNDYTLPSWLQRCIAPDTGPQLMAESYEAIEKTEQKRLKSVMAHHSRVTDNLTDHPFSIVAAMEKGALNRYTNIWPFEYTRVKLKDRVNDYINASYIQYIDVDTVAASSSDHVPTLLGLKEQNDACTTGRHYTKYISTQGPLPTTFDDFWTVVWDENSRVIVMLTKEEEMHRIKCHRYWPTKAESIRAFGAIKVKFISETEDISTIHSEIQSEFEEGLVLRSFEISKNDEEPRTIQQLHYKGWQDYGVPETPLGTLELVTLASKLQAEFEKNESNTGPMVVHCSAGCGRTGAFCTIDTVMKRLTEQHYLTEEEKAGQLDLIYQTVSKFREQRVSMVQTLRQYVYCYEAILWWILDLDNSQK